MRELDEDDGFAETRLLIANEKLTLGPPAAVDEAIKLLTEAVAMDFSYRPSALRLLARALDAKFEASRDVALLRQLTETDRELAALAGADRADLINVAIDLRRLFEAAGDRAALDEAVVALHATLDAPPIADPTDAMCQFELLVAHRSRFDLTADTADLDAAIAAGRAAVAAAAIDDAERPKYLSGLAGVLLSRGELSSGTDTLAEAAAASREAADATSQADPEWPARQGRLAQALRTWYERDGRPEALDDALAVLAGTITATRPGTKIRAILLSQLNHCWGLRTNLDTTRSLPIDGQVATARLIVDMAEPADPANAVYLANLSATLLARYEREGNDADLDAALAATRRSRTFEPPVDADLAQLHTSARRVLFAEYRRHRDPALLDDAIEAGRAAVGATAPDSPDLGPRLITLTALLNDRFEAEAGDSDLDEIVRCGERAVRAPVEDAETLLRRKTILAADLRRRFARTRHPADLERALVLLGELADQPPSAGQLGRAQSALVAESFYALGDQLKDLRARQQAVDAARRDVRQADDKGGPVALHRLSQALWREAQLTGDVAVLEEAVAHNRTLVNLVDDTNRASVLANLGRQLRALHGRTGDLAVLADAVDTLKRAIREASPDDPQIGGYLSSAANVIAEYGARAGQPHLAALALGLHRQAVAVTAEDDPARPLRLANLSDRLAAEFDRTGDAALVTEAVEGVRRALALVPPDHFSRPLLLTNLSQYLRVGFRAGRDRADLDASIDAARQALDQLPAGHQARSAAAHNLGLALSDRFELARTPDDLDGAIEAFRSAVSEPHASPDQRARSASAWGLTAGKAGRATDAVEGLARAVELLPMVSARDLERGDQEYRLYGYYGLAAEASAAALDVGDPERAVILLEQARGVLLSQALETRSDVTDLAARYPAIAEEFLAARDALNAGTVSVDESAEVLGRNRRERALAWQHLLDRIRQLPSFERFLMPPTLGELLAETAEGPIIMLTATERRSDALVLTTGGVRHVPLPGLTWAGINERRAAFTAALATIESPGLSFVEYYDANQAMDAVLGWLWDAAAGQVLDALERTVEEFPRVWWAPTGVLTFLPWHAAGHHDRRGERPAPTVLDRVVSSYTPTLRTLTHLRTRHPDGALTAAPVLVGIAEMPGVTSLYGVPDEISYLVSLMPHAVVLCDEQAIRDEVLGHLRDATLAHFACHGVSVPHDPSASRLLLYDYADRPLTVLDIARLHLKRARLAFLSACSTLQASVRLTDEAIHITSAFQLAGYPNVIGTLWTIDDLAAVDLAKRVYEGLSGDAARALHTAVREARDRDPDRPARWAAHVHAGV